MKSLRRLFAVTATAALCASAFAASDPTYTALRAARPDGRFIAVNNFAFDRDVYHFTLNGNLHLRDRIWLVVALGAGLALFALLTIGGTWYITSRPSGSSHRGLSRRAHGLDVDGTP